MIEFTGEVEIRLTPEEVFEFIANFENASKWNYFVTDVKKRSSRPIGVGTVVRADPQDRPAELPDHRLDP